MRTYSGYPRTIEQSNRVWCLMHTPRILLRRASLCFDEVVAGYRPAYRVFYHIPLEGWE